jgi:hypothetical protein
MEKIKTKNWKKGQADLTYLGKNVIQLRPEELHLLENGAKDESESFIIIMQRPGIAAFGQVSLKMLNEALDELGFRIIKTK